MQCRGERSKLRPSRPGFAGAFNHMTMPANSSLLFPWLVRVGPYAFSAVVEPPSKFTRPRWLSETDYNHEVIRVRSGLSPELTARHFWLRVVRAMHYSAG